MQHRVAADDSTSTTAGGARRRPTRLRWAAVPFAALAVLATACSGSDSSSNSGGSGGSGEGSTTIEVNAADCPTGALDSATGPVTVKVWHAYAGLTKTTLEDLATKYNASQSKVKVVVESQGSYEELLKKYEDSIADPKNLPDIALTEDTTTQFMIDSGSVVPASACIAADPASKATYDDILPAVTSAYTVGGVLWPAAFSVSTPVLYVNKSIFNQAGVDTTTLPANLDELRSTAEKIKAANVPGLQAPLVMKVDSWYLEHWLTGDNKAIVNENNGRNALATTSELIQPETTQVMEWLQGMVRDGLLKAIPSTSSGLDEYLAINNKTSAMLIQTSTAISTVAALLSGQVDESALASQGVTADVDQGLQIGFGPTPGIKAAGKGQIGGSGWYLVKGTDPAKIAGGWDFLKFFLQPANQVTWTLQASYLPVLQSAAADPALQQEFNSTLKGQGLSVAYNSLKTLDPNFPGPVIGPYNTFRNEVRGAMDNIMLSNAPIQPALDTANTNFQAALDGYVKDVGG